MAKAQTFGDKLKKKKADTRVHAKVIQGFRTPEGAMRFTERFVTVNDVNELEKVEVN
jgi:hypothetical protein